MNQAGWECWSDGGDGVWSTEVGDLTLIARLDEGRPAWELRYWAGEGLAWRLCCGSASSIREAPRVVVGVALLTIAAETGGRFGISGHGVMAQARQSVTLCGDGGAPPDPEPRPTGQDQAAGAGRQRPRRASWRSAKGERPASRRPAGSGRPKYRAEAVRRRWAFSYPPGNGPLRDKVTCVNMVLRSFGERF